MIPNNVDAAFDPGSGSPLASPDSGDFKILADAISGAYSVVSGCAVTAQGSPNMTVAVAAGVVQASQRVVTVAAGNATIAANATGNPRLDLVTIDTSVAQGVITVIQGTAAASPVWPAIAASRVVLALVYVEPSDTTIAANQIIDKRVLTAGTANFSQEPLVDGRQDFRRVNGKALEHWHAALASAVGTVNRTGPPATVWCIGDSWTEGSFTVSTDYQTWRWQLRDGVQRMFKTGGPGFIPCRRGFAPLFFAANPDGKNQWTNTNLVDSVNYGYGFGDRCAFMGQAAGTSCVITVDCDRAWLHFTTATTTATAQIVIDAGTAYAQTLTFNTVAFNATALSDRIWESPVLPYGTHTFTVTVSTASGFCLMDGITVFAGDWNTGVHFFDGSHSGYFSATFDPAQSANGAYWPDMGLQPNNPVGFTDGSGTTGGGVFTSATGAFTDRDIGELVWSVSTFGALQIPAGARITARSSGTSVTLSKVPINSTGIIWNINRSEVTDAVVTNTSATVTSATAAFTPWDVGKTIKEGTSHFLAGTKIRRWNSPTSVEMSNVATSGGSGQTLRIQNRVKYPTQPDLLMIGLGGNDMSLAVTSATYKQNIRNIVQAAIDRGGLDYTPSVILVALWAASGLVNWNDTSATSANLSPIITGTTGDYGQDLVGLTVSGTAVSGTVLSVQDPYHLTLSANATGNTAGTITFANRARQDFMWARYRNAMYELADENNWAFYDLYSLAGYIGTDPQNITADLTHGNDGGNQVIANELNVLLTGMPRTASIPQGIADAKGDWFMGTAADTVGKGSAGVDGQLVTFASASPLGGLPMDVGSTSSIGQILPVIGGTTALATGLPAPTLTATVTNADDNEAPWLNFATSATQFNPSGVVSAAFTVTRAGRLPEFFAYVKTDPTVITSIAYAIGLSSASLDVASAIAPAAAVVGAYFLYNTTAHGTAFWRVVTSDGTTRNTQTTSVAIAANTTYRLRIVIRGVRGTSVAGVDFYINDALVYSSTANLPTFSTPLGYSARVEALAAAAARNLKVARIAISGP